MTARPDTVSTQEHRQLEDVYELLSALKIERERQAEASLSRLAAIEQEQAKIVQAQLEAMRALQVHVQAEEATIKEIRETLKSILQMQLAFPVDERGAPDYIAHRFAHENDRETSALKREVLKGGLGKLGEMLVQGAILAMLAFMTYHISTR